MKPLFFAVLAAIAVQPLMLLLWLGVAAILTREWSTFAGLAPMSLIVMIVATPFVLVIGLPSGLLLRHHPLRGWWLAAIGFVAGALPLAPGRMWDLELLWRDPVALLPMVIFGAHGLAGAVAFHFAWTRQARGGRQNIAGSSLSAGPFSASRRSGA